MENHRKSYCDFLFSIEYRPRYSRLAGDLSIYKIKLEKRIEDYKRNKALKNEDLPEWAKKARELIEQTEKFLVENKIDEGWKNLHAAMRMEVYGMNDAELKAMANTLKEQAVSLDEIHKSAVLKLLGNNDEDTVPEAETLIAAIELKDKYYNDLYYQNRLTRNLYKLLFALLLICVIGIILYFVAVYLLYGPGFERFLTIRGQIIGVSIFGLLGAITSAILFTRNISSSSRKSEITSTYIITWSKLFIGVAFTIFIYVLLKSSFAGAIKLFNFSITTTLDYFAIAFVSGFSEQLAQKAISAIVGKDDEPNKK